MWRRRASQYPLPNKCKTNVMPAAQLRSPGHIANQTYVCSELWYLTQQEPSNVKCVIGLLLSGLCQLPTRSLRENILSLAESTSSLHIRVCLCLESSSLLFESSQLLAQQKNLKRIIVYVGFTSEMRNMIFSLLTAETIHDIMVKLGWHQ